MTEQTRSRMWIALIVFTGAVLAWTVWGSASWVTQQPAPPVEQVEVELEYDAVTPPRDNDYTARGLPPWNYEEIIFPLDECQTQGMFVCPGCQTLVEMFTMNHDTIIHDCGCVSTLCDDTVSSQFIAEPAEVGSGGVKRRRR